MASEDAAAESEAGEAGEESTDMGWAIKLQALLQGGKDNPGSSQISVRARASPPPR